MDNDMIIISRAELYDLIRDSNTLAALEIGGVDNWDWFGYSIKDYINTWKAENPDCWAGTRSEDVDIETISMFELEGYRTIEQLMGDIEEFVNTTLG